MEELDRQKEIRQFIVSNGLDTELLEEQSESFQPGHIQCFEQQEQRLDRIASLLKMNPSEARELLELMVEWLQSAGALTPKTAHLDKSVNSEIGANVSPEIKDFLIQNGLYD